MLLQVCTPQAFSITLASLAKLKVPLDASWLSAMLARSQGALPSFKPLELSNTIWALAKLNHKPDAAWLEAFLQSASICIGQSVASQTPTALPQQGAPAAVYAQPASQLNGIFAPQLLANVVWSLATLQCSPPAGWLLGALRALQPGLHCLNPMALTGEVWGLRQLLGLGFGSR